MPSYTYDSSNELTSDSSGSYTYDANGNTLSDPSGKSYTWDFENRLTSVVLPGSGGTVTFKYDPFGRRVQKSGPLGTTNYLYDGVSLLEEVDNSGSVLARYTQEAIDETLSEVRASTTSYYQQDGLGSTTSVSNSVGSLANTYSYDNYGKLIVSTGTVTNPFQYTGREFDQESAIYQYRHRYYDPGTGRFLTEDPIEFGGGINFYRYVRNSPVNFSDPLGLSPQVPYSRARTRPCNADEYSICSKICGAKGVQSCRVSQTFRVVRWKDGRTLWKWVDGPQSCSCRECNQKTNFELQLDYDSAYYMQQFWQDILIGDWILGTVATDGALGGAGPVLRPVPVPAP